MKKILKIQFWKAEGALAMQVLEQKGLTSVKSSEKFTIGVDHITGKRVLQFIGWSYYLGIWTAPVLFNTEQERDNYLINFVKSITEEFFTDTNNLEVGKKCEVSNDGVFYEKRKLVSILPKGYKNPFVTEGESYDHNYCFLWQYARPLLKSIEPTINKNGNVVTYTWEDR